MKLQYLGTAAAEAIPAVFCTCAVCKKARERKGRNLRSRSHAIVNDRLLIDFNSDTYLSTLKWGIDLADVHSCLLTHVHEDHLYTADFHYLREGFGHLPVDYPGFTLYGSEDILPFVEGLSDRTLGRFRHTVIKPFVPFVVEGMRVTALPARHGTAHPYIYAIEDGETAMLYGNDTGLFPEETIAYLQKAGIRFGLISLDCTEGAKETIGYDTHMCLSRNEICRAQLMEIGCADENTLFILHHFSHNGLHACYDDFAPIAQARGYLTSYDGMVIEY